MEDYQMMGNKLLMSHNNQEIKYKNITPRNFSTEFVDTDPYRFKQKQDRFN